MNTIGIIGAMPSEMEDIRRVLKDAEIISVGGYDFYRSETGGKTVYHVCCGVATVNAAICTQILVDRFQVDGVISVGIAGGMGEKVKVCDIVISDEVLYHDVDAHFLDKYPPYCSVYRADKAMITCAAETCESQEVPCFVGRIVSGDAFISSNEVKADIAERCKPMAVDMESAAIGHCAFRNKLPFVSVRCISDNADDDGEMSFETFEKLAAKRVAGLVLTMISRL